MISNTKTAIIFHHTCPEGLKNDKKRICCTHIFPSIQRIVKISVLVQNETKKINWVTFSESPFSCPSFTFGNKKCQIFTTNRSCNLFPMNNTIKHILTELSLSLGSFLFNNCLELYSYLEGYRKDTMSKQVRNHMVTVIYQKPLQIPPKKPTIQFEQYNLQFLNFRVFMFNCFQAHARISFTPKTFSKHF